ncbi:MAG: hypothetical protein DRN66_00525 [Candidatus Nanohalarchaeota archaeon]|nr:MAG: hypothetical protein DRN66_00525 [Candidatus Nanohaloarchaeota archaeon]
MFFSKKSRKAQTEIVSYLIVAGILVFSTGIAYMWGAPIIEKSSSNSKIKMAQTQLIKIDEKISNILLNGGQSNIVLNIDGELKIDADSNSIYCSFEIPSSHVTSEDWIPVSASNMWGVSGTEEESGAGRLGKDDPGVLVVRSAYTGDSYFITFRLAYRELDDLTTTGGKKVNLKLTGNNLASGKTTLFIKKGTPYINGSAIYGGDLIVVPIELVLK